MTRSIARLGRAFGLSALLPPYGATVAYRRVSGRARLVEFLGPPAVGKSTLLREIARRGGFGGVQPEALAYTDVPLDPVEVRLIESYVVGRLRPYERMDWRALEGSVRYLDRQIGYLKQDVRLRRLGGEILLDETGIFRKFRIQILELAEQGQPEHMAFLSGLLRDRLLVCLVAEPKAVYARAKERMKSSRSHRTRHGHRPQEDFEAAIAANLAGQQRYVAALSQVPEARFLRLDGTRPVGELADEVLDALDR